MKWFKKFGGNFFDLQSAFLLYIATFIAYQFVPTETNILDTSAFASRF